MGRGTSFPGGPSSAARLRAGSFRGLRLLTFALLGPLAQLGERLNGIQEVRGSTPLGSIVMNRYAGKLGWRNWQTRRIQDPVGVNPVRVRVPPRALEVEL